MSAAVKNSFQDYDPRHRLTGAVVLILLAVILLPMLLSTKPEPEKSAPADKPVVMEVTKEGNKVFVSRITAVDPGAVKSDVPSTRQKDTIKLDPTQSKESAVESSTALFKPMTTNNKSSAESTSTAKPAAKQISKQVTAKPSLKADKPKSPATETIESGWILQIGVFSQPENADKKVAELKKKGFEAKSAKVKSSKGMVTKVWIGPFSNRDSAERMQERLQHKTRQRGIVVENKS